MNNDLCSGGQKTHTFWMISGVIPTCSLISIGSPPAPWNTDKRLSRGGMLKSYNDHFWSVCYPLALRVCHSLLLLAERLGQPEGQPIQPGAWGWQELRREKKNLVRNTLSHNIIQCSRWYGAYSGELMCFTTGMKPFSSGHEHSHPTHLLLQQWPLWWVEQWLCRRHHVDRGRGTVLGE